MQTNTRLPRPSEGALGDQAGVGRVSLPAFLAGDIILFAGRVDFFSTAVRWVERAAAKSPTYAVYGAQFLDADRYLELDFVEKIKATGELLRKRQARDMWRRRRFAVWRWQALTDEQREALTRQALAYLGARGGMAKFLTHLLDGVINKVVRREVFFFRRLNHDQRYPICSWATAFSYDRAPRYRFGVALECADPDAIDAWVSAHPKEWAHVFQLEAYT